MDRKGGGRGLGTTWPWRPATAWPHASRAELGWRHGWGSCEGGGEEGTLSHGGTVKKGAVREEETLGKKEKKKKNGYMCNH